MIHLYNGGTKLAEYHTVGLPSSDFFASSNRWTMFHETLQPVPSIKGDGVPLIKEFTIMFGLKADTETQAKLEIAEARAYLLQATSIYYAEGQMWRALWGDERNLKRRAFYPQEISDVDSPCKWGFTIEFRPRFSEPTSIRAETKDDYDEIVGLRPPVDCGSDFTGFATQTEFEGEWAHIPSQATFSLTEEGNETFIKFSRNTGGAGAGLLYPTECAQPTVQNISFSLQFKFNQGSGTWFHSAGLQLRVEGAPTGFFSGDDYIFISVYKNNTGATNGNIYIIDKLDGTIDTHLDANASAAILNDVNYELSGSLNGTTLTYSLTNLDTDTLLDSGSETVNVTAAGYSAFYGETNANINDWVEVHSLELINND